jgi:hypothetical protein
MFIALCLVFYMCEVGAHTLWEKHRLQVFEKRVQRRIFQSKEVAGVGRKWFYMIHPSGNISH